MATTAPIVTPLKPLQETTADTLSKIFLLGVEKYDLADAVLFRTGSQWRPISHREMLKQVEELAAALMEMGIERGDRVAILSENRPEWMVADAAILLLGAASVPLYANLPSNHVAYILNDSGSKMVLVSTRDQLRKITDLRKEVPGLGEAVVFDAIDPLGEGTGLAEILKRGRKAISESRFPGFVALSDKIHRDDLATLIYTSGTTGDPKGVMLSHYNIASNVAAIEAHKVFDLHPGLIGLSFLPLSHSFERTVDYYFWYAGATIAYVDSMDRIGESMVEVRPHILAAAPRVFEKIYGRVMGASGLKKRLIDWAKRVGEATVDERVSGRRSTPSGIAEKLADRLVFSKLRAKTGGRVVGFVSGSAPLSPDIAKFFWAAGLPVYEGYGLTETSPVLNANRPGAVRLGTVGQPLPGTEIRIAPDGEIQARGPQIMKGYFGKPDATAEVLDSEGWFRTGDIGEVDADGFLTITDRIKNLIVTAGGKKIAPAPIENAAAMSPYVAQVLMIGDKRPFPSLLVVPDFHNLSTWAGQQGIADKSPEALSKHPRVMDLLNRDVLSRLTELARYEMPKKIAVIPDEFTVESGELTPSLKIKRNVVERNYKNVIEGIYASDHARES